MSAVDTQARRVSDFIARVTVTIIISAADGKIDPPELLALCDLADEADEEIGPAANEVAGAFDAAKRLFTVGLVDFLDPHMQAKVTDIAEGRIRREERRKEQETAARMLPIQAAGN